MIISTFVNIILFVVSCIIMSSKNLSNDKARVVPSIILTIILIIFGLLLLILILHHIYFICKGITTYEYLMSGKVQI